MAKEINPTGSEWSSDDEYFMNRNAEVHYDLFLKLTRGQISVTEEIDGKEQQKKVPAFSVVAVGKADGENRVQRAIENALDSAPFLKNNLQKARYVTVIYMWSVEGAKQLKQKDMQNAMSDFHMRLGPSTWGGGGYFYWDDRLEQFFKIVIVAEFEGGMLE